MKDRKIGWVKIGVNLLCKPYDILDKLFNSSLAYDKLAEIVKEVIQLSTTETK